MKKMNDIWGLIISALLGGLVLFFITTVPKDEDKDDNDDDFNIAIS